MAAALISLCGRNRALSSILHPKQNPPRPGEFEDKDLQYAQAGKHLSGMTMVSPRPESGAYMHMPPALPGYGGGPHDSVHSPSRPQYSPSDALAPGNPLPPSGMNAAAVPAYTQSSPLPSHQIPAPYPRDGPHEMDTAGRRNYQRMEANEGLKRYG